MAHTGSVVDPVVRRVNFGYFVRPADETERGVARVEPCLGYLVDHPDGLLLVDTGMGSHPEVDAHYQMRRRGLSTALAGMGVPADEIRFVVNCHLWIDRLQQFDPKRVVFAHDNAVWEPANGGRWP